jgi:urease accessory protein
LTNGIAEIGFEHRDCTTRLAHLYQRDPLRVLFPAPAVGDPPLGVIVTTSGGLVAGDRLDVSVTLGPGSRAHVTASAAEKIYRSTGPTTTILQSLSVGSGAALEFLPQETILFDGARLRRETSVDLAPGSGFLGGDIVVFGRRARGERFTSGFLREVWQVRRDGKLIWGDALHLDGDVRRIVDDPACFDGAAAFATMLLSPPERETTELLRSARAMLCTNTRVRAGATVIAGLVIVRWLAADAAMLRQAYAELAGHFRAAALGLPPQLPRSWHI